MKIRQSIILLFIAVSFLARADFTCSGKTNKSLQLVVSQPESSSKPRNKVKVSYALSSDSGTLKPTYEFGADQLEQFKQFDDELFLETSYISSRVTAPNNLTADQKKFLGERSPAFILLKTKRIETSEQDDVQYDGTLQIKYSSGDSTSDAVVEDAVNCETSL